MSETQDQQTETPETAQQDTAPRRRRGRVGLIALLTLAALALLVALAGFAMIGRPVALPDWAEERIESQVNRQLGGAALDFGQVSVVVENGWQPRIRLRDVDFRDAQGRHVLTLSDVEGTVALRPLLSGEVQPSRVWLSGMQLVLRRDASGQVGLSLGDAPRVSREAASLAGLIEEIDRYLVLPQLAQFEGLSAESLTLRYEDARAGRAWTVDGGRIDLERAGEDLKLRGDFALLGARDYASTLELSYQSRIGSPEAAFGMNFKDLDTGDIAAQSAALVWLDVMRAPVSGALRATTDAEGNLGPLNATLQIGEGVLQPTDETRPIPFRSARSYFTYSPQTQVMQVAEMSVDSEWGSMRAEGQVIVGELIDGWPADFIGQMRIAEISANPDSLYETPVNITDVTMDAQLKLEPFRLRLGQMVVRDDDRRLVLSGQLDAKEKGWDLALTGQMDRMGPERLLELWPREVKPRTRDWIAENILGGTMSNIQLALRSLPEEDPDVYLGFEFEGLDTLFMKSMPPIRGARGHATLHRNVFTVTADGGRVRAEKGGEIEIAGTTYRVPDVGDRHGPAEVLLQTRSTITAALSLLDREPMQFLTKAGQSVTLADGRAEAQGRIGFLRKEKLPIEEVDFDVTATLRDVRSETLVSGRVLAAPVLDVRAAGGELRIAGAGRIGAVPFEGRFVAPLGKDSGGGSRVSGWIELSQRFVEEFRVGLPPGSVSGATRGDVRIDLKRGERPRFLLSSDLAGMGMRIAPISWTMSKGAKGSLRLGGRLGDPVDISELVLDAPGLRAAGRLELGPGGVFRSATFDRVRAGSWLDASVALIGRGAGQAPEVRVTGGTVDLSQTEIGSGTGNSGQQGGGPITATLDRLRISESISLTGFKGEFSTARGMDGSFTGRVNGGAPVTGRVAPRDGRSAFRILSQDAGGVLASAGLLKSARGGDFDLTLLPAGGKGAYNGALEIKNIRLRDAPAMAALLNAISVIGLLEQLAGNGILFTDVEARFHMNDDKVTLTRSSAIGASMGISMDGYYYFANKQMQFQGVVSPIYVLNAVGQILTRKGEGLVGFNYILKGTPDSPMVRVNPLSLLTPGMFREIFRRPVPKVTQ
ncbi:hypothetical protein [Marimonas lutisalis]|uniref:hypothetical protein n=1 Tax=Marimonas lutisalis TaxID=2545756 RepID=UPI0010F76009|nr:hypothetical protein [Marimonas lutisalis]